MEPWLCTQPVTPATDTPFSRHGMSADPRGVVAHRNPKCRIAVAHQFAFPRESSRPDKSPLLRNDRTMRKRIFSRLSTLLVVSLFLLFSPIATRSAAPPDALNDDSFFTLPELRVAADTAWRFAAVDGFEILSSASDKASTAFVTEFLRELRLCRSMLPADFLPHPSTPAILILHSGSEPGAASNGWVGAMLSDRTDFDAPVFVVNVDWFERNAFNNIEREGRRLTTTSQYVSWLLDCRQPALPDWFKTGIRAVLGAKIFAEDQVTIPSHSIFLPMNVQTITDTAMPLREFFAHDHTSQIPSKTDVRQRQAGQFVLWGLADEKYRERFFTFVRRTAVEVESEALFAECVGLRFNQADRKILVALLAVTGSSSPTALSDRLSVSKNEKTPVVELRPARSTEIVRCIAEWRRQNALLIKGQPQQQETLETVRTLLLPYADKPRKDPFLLSVLGLCEASLAQTDSARAHLEQAFASTNLRPRALLELARLRFTEVRKLPKGGNKQLNEEQVRYVLGPLSQAISGIPVSRSAYRILVETWRHSEVSPNATDIALLERGRLLFPTRLSPEDNTKPLPE